MSDNEIKSFTQVDLFTGISGKGEFSLERYRSLFIHPIWMAVVRIVKDIKAFREGIDGSKFLIEFTEARRAELSEQEYFSNLKTLYSFLFSCYLSSEDWENYIKLWDTLRLREDLNSNYLLQAERSQVHKGRITPFILCRTESHLVVHFLYYKHETRGWVLS